VARHIAGLELIFVLLGVAPVLLFDAWMPRWAVVATLAAVPLLWLVRWLGTGSPVRATPLDLPVLLLLLVAPVGVWVAAARPLSLPDLYRITLGVALLYAAAGTLTSARRLRLLAALLLIAVPALALLALLGAQLSDAKFPALAALYGWIPAAIRPFWRPTGLGPNSVAGGLAMLLPLAIGFALGGKSLWLRIACSLASLFASAVLLLTGSRGALLGLALAVLVILIVQNRWFLLAIPAVILGGVAALVALGADRAGAWMLSGTATSAVESLEGRLEIWARALDMIRDFPFTGIGLGMFDRMLDLLYPLHMVTPEVDIYHPHNLFLFQATSGGLPGLIAWLALILLLFAMAAQSVRWSRRGEAWPLAMGLLGGLAAYVGHGLFDSPTSFIRAGAILWLLFGLQAALWLHLRAGHASQSADGASGDLFVGGRAPPHTPTPGASRPRTPRISCAALISRHPSASAHRHDLWRGLTVGDGLNGGAEDGDVPQRRLQGRLRIVLGALISLGCLVLVLRGVQWDAVAAAFGSLRLLPLAAAVALEFLTFWAIAARWQRLYAPHQPPSRARLFEILTVAQLVNGVLPAKLGPLVRGYLAGKGEAEGVAFALTTIAGEKLAEGASLLLVGAGLLPFVPLAGWLRPATYIGAGLLLAALVAVAWVAFHQEAVGRLLGRLLGRWPHLLGTAEAVLDALAVWRDRRAVAALAGWSLLIWAMTALLNQVLLWSLGIDAPPAAPLLLLVVLQIGVRVPSSPGSIGVFHYLSVLVLALFGVERDLALSYGVLLHLVTYLPPSLVGIAYLLRSGYSLRRLRHAAAAIRG